MPCLPWTILLALSGTCCSIAASATGLGSQAACDTVPAPNEGVGEQEVAEQGSESSVVAALQVPKQRGVQLRAAYIRKLASYITRKASTKPSKAPYIIAVVGKDSFADAIRQLLPGKELHKRKIEVVVVAPKDAATDNKLAIDLLYVASSVDAQTTKRIIQQHRKIATPLLSEQPGFAQSGGGLQLFIKDNKVKFEVNQTTLKEQGLHVSPQLMKLSTEGPKK